METISILQALNMVQNRDPEKISIYDPDMNAFHIFSDLESLRQKIKIVKVEIADDMSHLGIIGEGIVYYATVSETTKVLLDDKY